MQYAVISCLKYSLVVFNQSELFLMEKISTTEPDWSREQCTAFWQPSKQLLRAIRGYQKAKARKRPTSKIYEKWWVFCHRFWSIVCACDIPINCQLGGGILLLHPTGVVIHPDAIIGPNCLILQNTTIVGGVRIGGHVDIGAGAKIIAPITVGDDAKIGANAVVMQAVPKGATAVGVPARIISP